MTDDGESKFALFENSVPVGSPLTTTTAKNENECLMLCHTSNACMSASFNDQSSECALYSESWSSV